MRAFLTVQEGPAKGRVLTAEEGTMLRVGRQKNADISIENDKALSGLHFAIWCDKSVCRIRDLNSTNGTFVNGIRVNLVELFDRDTISAGGSEFSIRFEGQIQTTVVDPLVYPEVARLRQKDAAKKPAAKAAFAVPLAPVPSPAALPAAAVPLDATDPLPEDVVAIAKDAPQAAPPADKAPECIHRLSVTFQDATGQREIWLMPGQTIIVGRNQMSDVTVTGDPAISGVHFALDCEAERCRLRDLHSQNGVRLNGVAVPYATIYKGDRFVAGKTQFSVAIEGGTEAPDAPLRTWVFEDLVRRKFATFHAQELSAEYHLVDAVGTEPMPIELLRRLARHREVGVLVDVSKVDDAPWQAAAQRSHPCGTRGALHEIADVEQVVPAIRQVWGDDALAVLFPHEGRETALATLAEGLDAFERAEGPSPDPPPCPVPPTAWVEWLARHPEHLARLLAGCEAVFLRGEDAQRWRIVCETDFISRLNRLGYFPS